VCGRIAFAWWDSAVELSGRGCSSRSQPARDLSGWPSALPCNWWREFSSTRVARTGGAGHFLCAIARGASLPMKLPNVYGALAVACLP
jgi:hypothetical protein